MLEQSVQVGTAVGAAGCPVLILDEAGRVVSSNAMAQSMLGLSAEELIARYCRTDLVPSGQSDGAADSLAAIVASPLTVLTLANGDGDNTLIKGTCVTLDPSVIGRLLTLVILDQTKALAPGVVDLSGQRLANAAHEVRTPLCSIVGYLDLLADQYRTIHRTELGKIIKALQRSARWIERSVDNLLNAVDICAGHFSVEPAPVRLAELLTDAAEVVAILAAGKQQGLALVLPEAQATVWADRPRLLQVLANLLSNAIKHAPLDGQVMVSATEIGGQWQISVSDNSTGTPWWEQGYATGEAGHATRLSGAPNRANLGIAIAKYVIEQHGGTMGLTSSPEKGNTFWFTLPSTPAGMDGGVPSSTAPGAATLL